MTFTTGLVSVSFRWLSTESVIALTKESQLGAIEWGGDVHVPVGDVSVASSVKENTLDAGIKIPEYGSYYRLGVSDPNEIHKVVLSARALGTDCIRVWAYNKGSADVTAEEYKRVVEEARRICSDYPELTFCTECHNNTLTDDYEINLKLIEDVGMENFAAFWQPNQYKSHQYNLDSALALARYVRAVHVFAWEGDKKLPLCCHRDRWSEYLKAFVEGCDKNANVNLMLEFMHNNDPQSLGDAANELKNIISIVNL